VGGGGGGGGGDEERRMMGLACEVLCGPHEVCCSVLQRVAACCSTENDGACMRNRVWCT